MNRHATDLCQLQVTCLRRLLLLDLRRIIEIFKKFDTNSDGVISKEAPAIVRVLGPSCQGGAHSPRSRRRDGERRCQELTQLLNALGPEMFTKEIDVLGGGLMRLILMENQCVSPSPGHIAHQVVT